jgi:hypothetical protein
MQHPEMMSRLGSLSVKALLPVCSEYSIFSQLRAKSG